MIIRSDPTKLFILVSLFLLYNTAHASYYNFGVGTGNRTDDLSWNIAGNLSGTSPNILSELSWTNIKSKQVRLYFENVNANNAYFAITYDTGDINAGSVQDSDYFADNRGNEFSRSVSDANDGSTEDFTVVVGREFRQQTNSSKYAAFIPNIGYSTHEQDLRMRNGVQVVESADTPPLGPFPGLNSSYSTEWSGIQFGAILYYRYSPQLKFGLSYTLHDVDFTGKANWNLRPDFQHPVSFTHDAQGDGKVKRFFIQFRTSEAFAIELEKLDQDWSTGSGTDTVFFSDGSIGQTRLNEVKWTSSAYLLKVRFSY